MSDNADIKKSKDTVVEHVDKLYSTIVSLQKENARLKQRVATLEKATKSSVASPQTMTEPTSDLEMVSTSSDATSITNGDTPAFGPESVDVSNLDELLANDALVSTVYYRLVPLKKLKYRLLAMQMGISIDRCKIALEKLEKAGAVRIGADEVVTLLKKK